MDEKQRLDLLFKSSVASTTTRILGNADAYCRAVNERFARPAISHGAGNRSDAPAPWSLKAFDDRVDRVVRDFTPPDIRRPGEQLVFAPLYPNSEPARPADDAEPRVSIELMTALFAARVESLGPVRLNRTQNELLATVYERLGAELRATELPEHAALSFGAAAELYHRNEDLTAEDQCKLNQQRALCQALPLGWKRIGRECSDILFGYGYQPYRMLRWIAVQLLVFTGLALYTAPNGAAPLKTIYLGLTDFLNPVGYDDAHDGNPVVFVIESYFGTVSTSLFFALLVRRWFRL